MTEAFVVLQDQPHSAISPRLYCHAPSTSADGATTDCERGPGAGLLPYAADAARVAPQPVAFAGSGHGQLTVTMPLVEAG